MGLGSKTARRPRSISTGISLLTVMALLQVSTCVRAYERGFIISCCCCCMRWRETAGASLLALVRLLEDSRDVHRYAQSYSALRVSIAGRVRSLSPLPLELEVFAPPHSGRIYLRPPYTALAARRRAQERIISPHTLPTATLATGERVRSKHLDGQFDASPRASLSLA